MIRLDKNINIQKTEKKIFEIWNLKLMINETD